MIDRSKLVNSFEFVVTAGARARQLLAGAAARVAAANHKETTLAQQEVITRLVEKIGDDSRGRTEDQAAIDYSTGQVADLPIDR